MRAMIEVRLAKCVMAAALAFFALLVTFNNLTDYGSNFAFVQHVLSMDTTFPDNTLRYRAVTAPWLWHTAYALVILGEGLTGLALAAGAVAMARKLRGRAIAFARAKRFFVVGATMGFMVWFFGFMVVGGEWFAMWQSDTWNGQDAAFQFYLTLMAVLVFVSLEDGELLP